MNSTRGAIRTSTAEILGRLLASKDATPAARAGLSCLLCLALSIALVPACLSQAIGASGPQVVQIGPTQSANLIGFSSANAASPNRGLLQSPDGRVAVIVKLKTKPIVSRALALQPGTVSAAKTIHQKVAAKLVEIEARTHGRSPQSSDAARLITHHFYRAFSGLAARVSPKTVDELRKLPEVEEVYPDMPVKADLAASVPLINADDLQNLGFTGQGVKIAVIDTGVDYQHPDLGGGFGPGYKVIGGYDFVNRDADPMDDHGHGTHVAGIAAAKGAITGVAPNAQILAYKVLDSSGWGRSSTVVAGIERAMDPDQNPATDDAADIINMSLSTEGSGNENPEAQAVESATAAGVLCVCAAGNSGVSWNVCSPGSAPSALTVGATTKSDDMAGFSAWGPAFHSFEPKPDCVAPGENISSCKMGGGYVSMSGTSMATPHAAGVAALLKSAHPDWGPQMLKAAVVQGAIDLGKPLLTQGSGRIDALRSYNLPTLVTPSSLSLGNDATPDPIWQQDRVITIHNVSSADKTYHLTGSADSTGISFVISPSDLTVAAGQSAEVTVSVYVDNTTVTRPTAAPFVHACKVTVSCDAETTNVPVIFGQAAVLQLTCNPIPLDLALFNSATGISTRTQRIGTQQVYLAPGQYDILAYYLPSTYVIKERLDVKDTTAVTMDEASATYAVDIKPVDKDNLPLTAMQAELALDHVPTGQFHARWFYLSDDPFTTRTYTNGFSADYQLRWHVQGKSGGARYSARGYLDGVSSSVESKNNPLDFKHTYIQHFPDPTDTRIIAQHAMGFVARSPILGAYIWQAADSSYDVLSAPFVTELFSTPLRGYVHCESMDVITDFKYTSGTFTAADDAVIGHVPWLRTDDTHTMSGFMWNIYTDLTSQPFYISTSDYLPIRSGPIYWSGRFQTINWKQMVSPTTGPTNHLFSSQYYDSPSHPNLPCDIYSDGTLYKHITLPTSAVPFAGPLNLGELPNSRVTVATSLSNWTLAGRVGTTSVAASLDARCSDPNPPYIKRFWVTCDGEIGCKTVAGRNNQVVIDVLDEDAVSSLALSYRVDGGAWVPLSTSQNGFTYTAALPSLPVDEFISLRLVATDPSGNSLDMTVEPAFYSTSGSLSSAKSSPDGTWVALAAKPVVGSFGDAFNLEDPSRANGIRVLAGNPPAVDSVVAVSGMMGTSNGERVLTATTITPTGATQHIGPVAMQGPAVGGAANGLQAAVQHWAVTPIGQTRRLLSSHGPSNTGMLVKIWGTVTEIGSDYFYVDDGSGIDDGNPLLTKGVRVQGSYTGNKGDCVGVVGVSSCRITPDGEAITGLLRTRTGEDVVKIR